MENFVNLNLRQKSFTPDPVDAVALLIAPILDTISGKTLPVCSIAINNSTAFNVAFAVDPNDSSNRIRVGYVNGTSIGTLSDNVGITIRSRVSEIGGTVGELGMPNYLQVAFNLVDPSVQCDISTDGTTDTTVYLPTSSGNGVIALEDLASNAQSSNIGSNGLYTDASTFTENIPDADFAPIVALDINSQARFLRYDFHNAIPTIVAQNIAGTIGNLVTQIGGTTNFDLDALYTGSNTMINNKTFDRQLTITDNINETTIERWTKGADLWCNLYDSIDIYFYSIDGQDTTVFGEELSGSAYILGNVVPATRSFGTANKSLKTFKLRDASVKKANPFYPQALIK